MASAGVGHRYGSSSEAAGGEQRLSETEGFLALMTDPGAWEHQARGVPQSLSPWLKPSSCGRPAREVKAQDASRHAGLRVQNGVLITQERHWGEAVMWLQAGTVPLTMGRGWRGLAGRFQVWREHIQVGEEFRAWGRLFALPQTCSLETMLETTAGPHRCNQGPPPRSQWWAFPTSRGGGGLPARPTELPLAAVWAAR